MISHDRAGYFEGVNFGLERRRGFWDRCRLDPPLLFALITLIGFGLMVLYSATDGDPGQMRRQVTFFGLALVAMGMTAQIDVRILRRWTLWLYLGSLVLLAAVLQFGVRVNGAMSWLDLPGLPRFQPSEILKVVVPLSVAGYLARRPLPPKFKHIFWALVILAIPVGLVLLQPDFGTALMLAVSGMFVILLAGVRWKLVFTALALGICSLLPMWLFYFSDYQKNRILTFLNPEADPLGTGWNIIQSKTAVGSGGLFGKGWLNGVQSRLDFLPESQTDFIVAVLAEEFGLVGMLFLLLLYVVIIARGLYISAVARDMFSRLLAGSIVLTFFVYLFVNIGMVTGILPVVGIPLPLVSRGGTSVVTLMVGFGILMSIHSHGKTDIRYTD